MGCAINGLGKTTLIRKLSVYFQGSTELYLRHQERRNLMRQPLLLGKLRLAHFALATLASFFFLFQDYFLHLSFLATLDASLPQSSLLHLAKLPLVASLCFAGFAIYYIFLNWKPCYPMGTYLYGRFHSRVHLEYICAKKRLYLRTSSLSHNFLRYASILWMKLFRSSRCQRKYNTHSQDVSISCWPFMMIFKNGQGNL